MAVHGKDYRHIVDRDPAGPTKTWLLAIHQGDPTYHNESPGYAPSAAKSLTDAALNAANLAAFDASVASILPTSAANWYAALPSGDRTEIWNAVKDGADIR